MQKWALSLHLIYIVTCVMLSLVCTISCLIAVIKKPKCVPFFFIIIIISEKLYMFLRTGL